MKEVRDEDIQGSKYVGKFLALVKRIRSASEAEARDPRQELDIQQLGGHLLFYFFTPLLTSLRSIQRASELKKVQKLLGCSRVALGSLSEANSVFDPEVLRRVIHELVGELEGKQKLPRELKGLTAVDGTFLRAVPRMFWALFRRDEKRGVKAHVLFDVELAAPIDVSLTDANTSEKAELRKMIEAGRLYVLDAGYAQYQLFNDIIEAKSSFVCRIRDNAVWDVLEERKLSEGAIEAGVKRDQVVRLGKRGPREVLKHSVRVIEFQRPRTRPDEEPGLMLLATDRLDLDAELVTLAYRYRWSVELFFRWLKCVLGCRDLISRSENGVTIQIYMGIIASLLVSVWTGRKPNKALLERLSFYLMGMADDEELEAAIRQQAKHDAKKG